MFSEYWNENISTQANKPTLFEDLFAQAAQNFPPNDGKPAEHMDAFRMSPMSPFSSSSGSSSTQSARSPDTWPESDDSDTDIDPLLLEELRCPASEDAAEEITRAQPFPKVEPCDSPFLPPTRYSSTGARTDVLLSMHVKLRKSASPSPPPFIPVSPPPHRFARRSPSVASSADAEYEVDFESDGNVSDDEYVPSPALGPRKHSRPSVASSAYPKEPLHLSLTAPIKHRHTKRARQAPPSRNMQAISPAAVRAALVAARNKTQLTCIACHWTQTNGRMPDFKRHLKTHLRPDDKDQTQGWWCKGVLLKDAAEHSLPASLKPFLFADQWRVGGCERTFSRRDALKRHLDNENVTCVGRPCDASED